MIKIGVALVAAVLATIGQASSATVADLAQITARGRALYAYDAAAAAASDAVVALTKTKKMPGGAGYYVGHVEHDQWIFDFGALSADGATLTLFAQARENGGSGKFDAQLFASPQPGSPFDLAAARAVNLATTDFGPVQRPYNYAELQQPNGTFYVYEYPAQTDSNIHPLGGDERYIVSADGKTILDKHRMHRTILEIPTSRPQAGLTLDSTVHSDIFSDVPEDTDVFNVLIRRPSVPDYVVGTSGEMYLIQTDGTIVDKGNVKQH